MKLDLISICFYSVLMLNIAKAQRFSKLNKPVVDLNRPQLTTTPRLPEERRKLSIFPKSMAKYIVTSKPYSKVRSYSPWQVTTKKPLMQKMLPSEAKTSKLMPVTNPSITKMNYQPSEQISLEFVERDLARRRNENRGTIQQESNERDATHRRNENRGTNQQEFNERGSTRRRNENRGTNIQEFNESDVTQHRNEGRSSNQQEFNRRDPTRRRNENRGTNQQDFNEPDPTRRRNQNRGTNQQESNEKDITHRRNGNSVTNKQVLVLPNDSEDNVGVSKINHFVSRDFEPEAEGTDEIMIATSSITDVKTNKVTESNDMTSAGNGAVESENSRPKRLSIRGFGEYNNINAPKKGDILDIYLAEEKKDNNEFIFINEKLKAVDKKPMTDDIGLDEDQEIATEIVWLEESTKTRLERSINIIEEENLGTTLSGYKYTGREPRVNSHLVFKNINA